MNAPFDAHHFIVNNFCQICSLFQRKRASFLQSLERFRFGFQYLYRYLNLSFSQSDVPDIPDWPIKLFKSREKVAVVVEEVKSEPLYELKTS